MKNCPALCGGAAGGAPGPWRIGGWRTRGPYILCLIVAGFAVPVASTATFDLTSATIADIHAAMDAGELTAEKLTALYLARIAAFDQQGPKINAVITLNPDALAQARALDLERKNTGPRSPVHGIPIVLKDNFDTFDLPTTAGCYMLKGSLPPDDAFVVKKLRDAGAIILAKVNLSEFASGGGAPNGFSSMGGQTRNPHDLTRGPSGSSGGTGAAIAAAFAQFGLGSDTSSSVRGPSAAGGIVGLRPTLGLMSRDGIVPLALTFDSGGPMARSVFDVAVALGIMTGVDPADDATKPSAGRFETDYTKHLDAAALKGARIGVARDFFGRDVGTDRVMEWTILRLQQLGATVIDPVKLPPYVLEAKGGIYSTVRSTEFPRQLNDYLATLKPEYPRTLAELIARAGDPMSGYMSPWKLKSMKEGLDFLALDDPTYLAAKNEGRAMLRAAMDGIFAKHRLDALVYPTSPGPVGLIDGGSGGGGGQSPLNIAPQVGYPDLVVPAGLTADGLPVTVSFLGLPFTEGKLFGYGFAFEQAVQARVLPKHTPALPAETLQYRSPDDNS